MHVLCPSMVGVNTPLSLFVNLKKLYIYTKVAPKSWLENYVKGSTKALA